MIFYLMGKSSSGKDTIYRRLLEDGRDRLNHIVMYTTRPVRAGERDGEEYHFVDTECMENLKAQGRVIEQRSYNTVCGIWNYFSVKDETIDPIRVDYLAIGTLESFISTRDYYGEGAVIPIMIELDDGIRLQRALDREKTQTTPRYNEMCRRFLADSEDFSPGKLKEAGVVRTFCNENLENCLLEIKSYMDECCGKKSKV